VHLATQTLDFMEQRVELLFHFLQALFRIRRTGWSSSCSRRCSERPWQRAGLTLANSFLLTAGMEVLQPFLSLVEGSHGFLQLGLHALDLLAQLLHLVLRPFQVALLGDGLVWPIRIGYAPWAQFILRFPCPSSSRWFAGTLLGPGGQ
jgi:hypothetical protein